MTKLKYLLLGLIGALGLFFFAFIAYGVTPQNQATGGTATSTKFTTNSIIYQGSTSYAGATLGSGLSLTGGVLSATGGTGNSTFLIGSGFIYNATSTDTVMIGSSTLDSSFIKGQTQLGIVASSTLNNYNEINYKCKNSGSLASVDYTMTSDIGGPSTYYGDLGLNCSGFTRTSSLSGAANDLYLFNSDNSLYLGTASTTNLNANIYLVSQGTNIATGTVTGLTISNATTTNLTVTGTCTGCGALSGGVNGKNAYWTGATALGASGDVFDNGTVSGVNATSSSFNFDIQGQGATVNPFNVASSSGATIFRVFPTNGILMNQNASTTNSSFTVAAGVSVLQLGTNSLSSPTAGGTYIGINSPGSFNGNFADFQLNGVDQVSITSGGSINASNAVTANQAIFSRMYYTGPGSANCTAGTVSINFTASINLVSGNNQSTCLVTNGGGDVNQPFWLDFTQGSSTSTLVTYASNIYGGAQVDQRLKSTTIQEFTFDNSGNNMYAVGPAISNDGAAFFSPYVQSSTSPATIATSSTVTITGAQIASTTNLALTNSIGLLVQSNNVTASTTNAYGEYIQAPTGATNNYSAYFNGRVLAPGLTTSAATQLDNLCWSSVGEIIADSGNCVLSGQQYKTDIQPLDKSIDELMKLNPVSFWYNPDLRTNPDNSKIQYGLIAQEVQKVDPNLITVTDATTTYDGVSYPPGTPDGLQNSNVYEGFFIKVMQDQQKEIEGISGKFKDVQDKWQDILLGLFGIYIIYNEWDKRRK